MKFLKSLFNKTKEKEIQSIPFSPDEKTQLKHVGSTTTLKELDIEAEENAYKYEEVYVPMTQLKSIESLYRSILLSASFTVDIDYFNQEFVKFEQLREQKRIDNMLESLESIINFEKLRVLSTDYRNKVIKKDVKSNDVFEGHIINNYLKEEDKTDQFNHTMFLIGEKLINLIDEASAPIINTNSGETERLRLLSLLVIEEFYNALKGDPKLSSTTKNKLSIRVKEIISSYNGINAGNSILLLLIEIHQLYISGEFWRLVYYSVLQERQIEIEIEKMMDRPTSLILSKIDIILVKAETAPISYDSNFNRKGILQDDIPASLFHNFAQSVQKNFALSNHLIKEYNTQTLEVVELLINKLVDISDKDDVNNQLMKLVLDKNFTLDNVKDIKELIPQLKEKEAKTVIIEKVVEKEVEVVKDEAVEGDDEYLEPGEFKEEFDFDFEEDEEDFGDIDFDIDDIESELDFESEIDSQYETQPNETHENTPLYNEYKEDIDNFSLGFEAFKDHFSKLLLSLADIFENGIATIDDSTMSEEDLTFFNIVKDSLISKGVINKFVFDSDEYYAPFNKDNQDVSDCELSKTLKRLFGVRSDSKDWKIGSLISLHDNTEHGLAIYHSAKTKSIDPYLERSTKKFNISDIEGDLYANTKFSETHKTAKGIPSKTFSIHADIIKDSTWIEVENITDPSYETLTSKRWSTLKKIEKYALIHSTKIKRDVYDFERVEVNLVSEFENVDAIIQRGSSDVNISINILDFFKSFIRKEISKWSDLEVSFNIIKKDA